MIQAHGENFFHTRPYARTDPSAAMFSFALQAMGGTNPPTIKGAASYTPDSHAQAAPLLPSPPTNQPHPHPHRHNLHDPSAQPSLPTPSAQPPLPAPGQFPGECAPRPLFSPTHNL